jgi:uncharacterized membrane protein
MHTGPRVTWEQSESSSRRETDEPAKAATAYLAWPLAFFELFRGTRTSLWYRAHLRQAAVLGALGSAIFLLALALPLGIVLALGGPGDRPTIAIYVVAMVLDFVVLLAAAWVSVRCALRASRGELFSLPLVTQLSERLFLRRDA